MKIYSMTATFGKLENRSLEFKPGLNIIEAPNEWGKSTWCAFLVAMLYGIDTKARTTQAALADKEHYAPWSGAPMEGRMDICWQGRDITIERRTKGRLVFGEFRAYETETGLDVPELTSANCGMQLLGVERSVFVRAGFLRLADMPVTQDDALRRRLNNLVTTGDESGAGDKLAQTLKDLKNKCRHNKTGLLPQAEAERDRLEEQLHALQDLNDRAQQLQARQRELDSWIAKLENHKKALDYAQAQADSRHIRDAEAARDGILAQVKALEVECAVLPSEEEAVRAIEELQQLNNESMSLQMEQQMLPTAPVAPEGRGCFAGLNGEQAVAQAKADGEKTKLLKHNQKQVRIITICMSVLAVIMAVLCGFFAPDIQYVLYAAAALMLASGLIKASLSSKALQELIGKYEAENPDLWLQKAEEFAKARKEYEAENAAYQQTLAQLQSRRVDMVSRLQALTGGEAIGICLDNWGKIEKKWKELGDARREFQRMDNQIAALMAMSRDVTPPAEVDDMTYTSDETALRLNNAIAERNQNQLRLGQFQGQADALGQESALRAQLKQVRSRIQRLEETYDALELAQKALSSATSELQRRFAPRIAKRTQELFSKLTGGRYDKLMLTDDLSIEISTKEELTPRKSQWRSDGTVDQLYLALRLAVAEELTPDAPLVLDDAMVRFDDDRLKVALDILAEMAENKQVILFTCQSREKKLQGVM